MVPGERQEPALHALPLKPPMEGSRGWASVSPFCSSQRACKQPAFWENPWQGPAQPSECSLPSNSTSELSDGNPHPGRQRRLYQAPSLNPKPQQKEGQTLGSPPPNGCVALSKWLHLSGPPSPKWDDNCTDDNGSYARRPLCTGPTIRSVSFTETQPHSCQGCPCSTPGSLPSSRLQGPAGAGGRGVGLFPRSWPFSGLPALRPLANPQSLPPQTLLC